MFNISFSAFSFEALNSNTFFLSVLYEDSFPPHVAEELFVKASVYFEADCVSDFGHDFRYGAVADHFAIEDECNLVEVLLCFV